MVKIKDIDENLNYALASLLLWINCARAPIASCESLLGSRLSDDKKMHQAARVWVIATVIGLICQIPIFGLLGVDWKKIEFYLPSVLFLLLAFLITVAVLHAGFRLFKIKSGFADTLVLYSVLIGTYSPLVQVLVLPGMYDIIASMKSVKAPGMGIKEVVGGVFAQLADPAKQDSILGIYNGIASFVQFVISMFLIVLFARFCGAYYGVERHRAVAATAFSMGLLFPLPLVVIGLLYYSAIYAAL